MYWQTANVDILRSQCNLLRASCSTPSVSRGQLSLSGTQLRARAVLTLRSRRAHKRLLDFHSASRLHTSAWEENFPKTFYRNFVASPPTAQTASRNSSTEEEAGQEVPYLYSIEHVCACIALDIAQICFCFSFLKKSRNEERKVLSTSLFVVVFGRFLFVTHCGIVSLVVLQRPGFYCSRNSSSRDPSG